jgi:hypothetical protein
MNMHKIYSRPRIKIPKITISRVKTNAKSGNINNIKKINGNKFKIIIIVTIAIITVRIILGAIYPIFDTLCESKAKSIATIISNEEATNVMKGHSYDELFLVEKDSNNNITMIKSNVIKINEITSDISGRIQKRIDNTERENIEIALRQFYRI